ncbi:hypothetical protein JT105_02435 [Helicobacter pylori]|nr:hypothetical protein HPNQ4161_0430 [Helicobacter pylori NQ4161]MCQ2692307.1 hypothetical protein [Helicobacter pylori]NHA50382.1 hypothetical protein [Helicobacter pylori]
MLLNYDFLEFENDKKVRVIDDKLCVNILDFFGIGDENDKIFLGDEISNIKDNPTEAYAAEVYAIEGAISLIECMRKLGADYLLGLSQRLDLLKEFLQRILLMKSKKRL